MEVTLRNQPSWASILYFTDALWRIAVMLGVHDKASTNKLPAWKHCIINLCNGTIIFVTWWSSWDIIKQKIKYFFFNQLFSQTLVGGLYRVQLLQKYWSKGPFHKRPSPRGKALWAAFMKRKHGLYKYLPFHGYQLPE